MMLIPPNAPLLEALKPVREDLIQLYKGFKASKYEDNKSVLVEAKGAISVIIGDHPQACEISRHLGVPANMNCRLCWVSIEDRGTYSSKLFDYNYTRRRVQTDLIIQQMSEELERKNTKKHLEELQKKTGIRYQACPLDGVEVDPHLQCFPDFDHFFDLGLCMRFFNFICNSLTSQQQEDVNVRLKSIQMPRGWNSFTLNLRSVSKKMKPMTYIRKLCVLSLYLFKGFIEDDVYDLLQNMIMLRGLLLKSFQTSESITHVSFISLLFYCFWRAFSIALL